ncbi:MAG: hypothetical protein NW223_24110 [Hyphomicrobiaceae bacterium]|nr:hypothetical protein [Hyphomicrobiaceae bacterium]
MACAASLAALLSLGTLPAHAAQRVSAHAVGLEQPPSTMLRRAFGLAYGAARWLHRFSHLAPYAGAVMEAMDEMRRLVRDTHRAAELARKLDELWKRIDALEQRLGDKASGDIPIRQMRRLLELLSDEADRRSFSSDRKGSP